MNQAVAESTMIVPRIPLPETVPPFTAGVGVVLEQVR